jgi:hypothetical protein
MAGRFRSFIGCGAGLAYDQRAISVDARRHAIASAGRHDGVGGRLACTALAGSLKEVSVAGGEIVKNAYSRRWLARRPRGSA